MYMNSVWEPIIAYATLHRICRVSETPVMEITVTYPFLVLPDPLADNSVTSAVERFCEAYRAIAEVFLTRFAEELAEKASEAFRAGGAWAAYTFDRRTVNCRMEAEVSDGVLTVNRTVTTGSRRGHVPTVCRESRDRWRMADLSLMPLDSRMTENRAES